MTKSAVTDLTARMDIALAARREHDLRARRGGAAKNTVSKLLLDLGGVPGQGARQLVVPAHPGR